MDWLNGFFGLIIPLLDEEPLLRAIIGFILICFLPGFLWSLVFLQQITIIERIALSFGLSVVLVVLSILLFNIVLNVPINSVNSIVIIILLIMVPSVLYCFIRYRRRRRSEGN